MIRIDGLSKSYGDLKAVTDLSLSVAEGEIVALLGPNGAGKTTTVSCLVGLLAPDAGRIEVCGVDALAHPTAAKRRIGYVPEVASLYSALTAREFLELKGRLFDLPESSIASATDRLLTGFGLAERQHEAIGAFSKGMAQKVALAAALLPSPDVLVLDEPLSGLDVSTTLVTKELLREFARLGGSVLYCSHLLDVVETLADKIAVLEQGQLQAVGTLDELRESAGSSGDARLERVFQQLTAASDPVSQAQQLLGE